MQVLDVISLSLSLLGISSLVLNIRYILPHNVTPIVSVLLDESYQLLCCAEEIGAVPTQSEYKRQLDCLTIRFMTMRMEINHAHGTFQQLRIGVWCGLTWKLVPLHHRIEAIKSELELEVDKKKLINMGSVVSIIVAPCPVSASATTVNSVDRPTLPLPATMS